jgi:hypothetical protein
MIKMASAFACFAVAMTTLLPAAAEASGKTDQIRVVYVPPKNPAHVPLVQFLKQRNFHQRLREFLSPIRLPRKLTFKLVGCDGELNAEYDEGVVAVCYDYIAFMQDLSKKVPSQIGISDEHAMVGAALDLLLHEFGHAVFDLLKIPILGREEDAADQFSAYIMLQFAPKDAYGLIVSTAYVSATEARSLPNTPSMSAYAKEHSLPLQRYFSLLCLAYGSDPKTFKRVITVGNLPEARAEGCEDEYKQVQFGFNRLIRPHIDQSLAAKVRKTKWFNF